MFRRSFVISFVGLATSLAVLPTAGAGDPSLVGKWRLKELSRDGKPVTMDLAYFKKNCLWVLKRDGTGSLPGFFTPVEIKWKYDAETTSFDFDEKNGFGSWVKGLRGTVEWNGDSRMTYETPLGGAMVTLEFAKE
jgi:hypothetical protein